MSRMSLFSPAITLSRFPILWWRLSNLYKVMLQWDIDEVMVHTFLLTWCLSRTSKLSKWRANASEIVVVAFGFICAKGPPMISVEGIFSAYTKDKDESKYAKQHHPQICKHVLFTTAAKPPQAVECHKTWPAYTCWPEFLLQTLGELLQAACNANDRRHKPAINFTNIYHLLADWKSRKSFRHTVTLLESSPNCTRLLMWNDQLI